MQPSEVVAFWRNAGAKSWFRKDPAFDAQVRERFLDLHFAASRGELANWSDTADGALALLLLLDQFPRNLFRGSPHAYATDGIARAIARRALDCGFDQLFEPQLRPFFYLPFEHSEEEADQSRSVELTTRHQAGTGDGEPLKWALIHQEIITRFGRFPHRNLVLGL